LYFFFKLKNHGGNKEGSETFLDKDGNIPVLDEENLIKRRKELGWE